jgi:hypothetical protein
MPLAETRPRAVILVEGMSDLLVEALDLSRAPRPLDAALAHA